jgi:uncharacterized delta-60 repeat protein
MKKVFLFCMLSSALLFGQNNTLDSTYANNGIFKKSFTWLPDFPGLVNIIKKNDGNILLFMRNTTEKFLYQVLPNGQFDSSFGTNGKIIISDMPVGYDLRSLVITPNQKLIGVVLFNPPSGAKYLTRLLSNGKLDKSFGNNGFITDILGKEVTNSIYQIFPTKNNDFFITGDIEGDTTIYQWAVAKYKANGNLDSSFNGGIVSNLIGESESSAIAMAEQSDGEPIVYGWAGFSGGKNYNRLQRYRLDGKVDSTFGKKGTVLFENENNASYLGSTIKVQKDNKILCGVSKQTTGNIYRFNSNGGVDNSFAKNGVLEIPNFNIQIIDLQDDGKLLLGGSVVTNIGQKQILTLYRYDATGKLDASFGKNGVNQLDLGNVPLRAATLFLDDQKRIIFGGSGVGKLKDSVTTTSEIVILRYKANKSGVFTNDLQNQRHITLYPNPASDFLHIALESAEETKDMNIIFYDLLGKIKYQGVLSSSIDVHRWSAGIYTYQLFLKNKIIQSGKWLKIEN